MEASTGLASRLPRLRMKDDIRNSLKVFTRIYNVVEEYFADPLNPDKAVYKGAIPFRLTPGLTRRRTSRKDCAQLQYR